MHIPRHKTIFLKSGIGILLSVLLLFLILPTWCSPIGQENKSEGYLPTYLEKLNFPSRSSDHQIGVTESILNNDPDNAISIHYPVFGLDQVDTYIREKIHLFSEQYEAERENKRAQASDISSSLWIDYTSYTAGNRYASVAFQIGESFSSQAHPDERVVALTFDLQKQTLLTANDIFQGEYLLTFCGLTRDHFSSMEPDQAYTKEEQFDLGSAPIPGNYQNFCLTDSGVILYFQKYQLCSGSEGILSYCIPYEKLTGLLSIQLTGTMLQSRSVSTDKASVQPTDPTPIDKRKPMVALTFDDGPHGKVTPMILDILKQSDAKATFFVVGNRVDSYASVLQREYEEGHEIGNHTYSHPSLTKLKTEEMLFQSDETDRKVSSLVSFTPQLLRPPYGSINETMKATLKKPFVLWSIDSSDWKTQNKNAIVSEVLTHVKDGDIILMHDLYPTTAQACAEFIPKLKEQGYQFVTVSELLAEKEIVPVAGTVYRLAK